jgi:hypothetical protein
MSTVTKVVKKKVKKVKKAIIEENREEELDEASLDIQPVKVVKKRKVVKRKVAKSCNETESNSQQEPLTITDANTDAITNTNTITFKDSIDIVQKNEPKLFIRYVRVVVGNNVYKSYWSMKEYDYIYLSDYNLHGICRKCYYFSSYAINFINMIVEYPIKRFIKEYSFEYEIIKQAKRYNMDKVYVMFNFMKRKDLYKYFLELKLKKCYLIDLTLNYASPDELQYEEIYKHGLQKPMKVFVMNEERLEKWKKIPQDYSAINYINDF